MAPMSEKERIEQLFYQNYVVKDHKPTILYGLSSMTKYILEAYPDYPVIGLLDGYKEDGDFCNKAILKLEDIKGFGAQIIILARKASEKVIFHRIKTFCEEYGIDIYSLEGERLREKEVSGEASPYFNRSLEELRRLIEDYECISFDIFDTLVTRKVKTPYVVFSLMEQRVSFSCNFELSKERFIAEKELSLNGVPNIYEIYEHIGKKCGLDKEEQYKLAELELEIEQQLLVPRYAMVEILQEAVEMGKPVYLISDMYLPKEDIEVILNKFGICNYQELFVSCEYRTGKGQRLYECFKQAASYSSYLHIGDSEEFDGACAREYGMDTYLIKSPWDMAELISLSDVLLVDGRKTSYMQGLFMARAYNSPFSLFNGKGKMPIYNAGDLGYLFVGPILLGFVIWLIEELYKNKIDRILFISRDGYLVKKIFDRLETRLKSDYFLISRTASVVAGIRDEHDVEYAAGLPYAGDMKRMLLKRFHLSEREIKRDVSTIPELLKYYQQKILEKATQERENYRKYISGYQIGKGERIAVFDFVSTGTCHMNLERIMDMKLTGFYFERVADDHVDKKDLNVIDFINGEKEMRKNYNYLFLEPLIKECTPSLQSIREDGSPIYCKEYYSPQQVEYIGEVQKGALEFVDDYIRSNFKEKIENVREYILGLLSVFNDEHFHISDNMVQNYDEFSARMIELGI